MLMIFTASLWIIGGYILRLCERQVFIDIIHGIIEHILIAYTLHSFLEYKIFILSRLKP